MSRNARNISLSSVLDKRKIKIGFLSQDIRDPIVCNDSIDYIFHFATESSTSLSFTNPLMMHDVIVNGTKNILDFAVKNNVKRILFTSSGAIYGNQKEKISESLLSGPDPLNYVNSYGCAKRYAESIFSTYKK